MVTSYSVINTASVKRVWSSWFQSIMQRIKNGRDPVTYCEDTGGYLVPVSPYRAVALSALNNLVVSIMLLKVALK